MIIGIPREIKDNEYRVSMTPGGVHQLNERGHTVLVETGAGGGQLFLRRGLRRRGSQNYRLGRGGVDPG